MQPEKVNNLKSINGDGQRVNLAHQSCKCCRSAPVKEVKPLVHGFQGAW